MLKIAQKLAECQLWYSLKDPRTYTVIRGHHGKEEHRTANGRTMSKEQQLVGIGSNIKKQDSSSSFACLFKQVLELLLVVKLYRTVFSKFNSGPVEV